MTSEHPYPPDPNSQTPKPQHPPSATSQSGFLSALFDLSFTKFVTISFAKFIYVIAIVGVALNWLVLAFLAFSNDASTGIVFLLFGWIPALLWLLFVRLFIEMAVAVIRTAINTGELVRLRQ